MGRPFFVYVPVHFPWQAGSDVNRKSVRHSTRSDTIWTYTRPSTTWWIIWWKLHWLHWILKQQITSAFAFILFSLRMLDMYLHLKIQHLEKGEPRKTNLSILAFPQKTDFRTQRSLRTVQCKIEAKCFADWMAETPLCACRMHIMFHAKDRTITSKFSICRYSWCCIHLINYVI